MHCYCFQVRGVFTVCYLKVRGIFNHNFSVPDLFSMSHFETAEYFPILFYMCNYSRVKRSRDHTSKEKRGTYQTLLHSENLFQRFNFSLTFEANAK